VIQQSKRPKYIAALDGIRGLAILLVLLIHIQQTGVVPAEFHLVNLVMHGGWCGVDLFFVLSGFLITLGLLDSKGSSNYFSAFYMRRVLRIFPLYYTVLASVIICSALFVHYPIFPSWRGWISQHILFVENWWMPWKDLTNNVLAHFWSLGIEEQFYFVWPACVWLLPRRRLAVLSVAVCAVVLALRFYVIQHYNPLPLVIFMNTVTRVDTLMVGALCAIVMRDDKLLAHVRRWLPTVAAIGACCVVVIILGVRGISAQRYYTQTLGFTALALAFGPLVMWAYLFSGGRNWYDRFFSMRPLTNLGKYSYGIYVYHYPVIVIAKILFGGNSWFGHDVLRGLLFSFGAVVVAVCVAVISYELFEKRFLRLKRYFEPSQKRSLEREVASTAGSTVAGAT
jgi:peptidoglycan/LPS O-acetylase OafA/YrhL